MREGAQAWGNPGSDDGKGGVAVGGNESGQRLRRYETQDDTRHVPTAGTVKARGGLAKRRSKKR